MARVELKNLTKIYGQNTVVDHINLIVEDGTLVSILGPSGCGKTTTLRMIAGFEKPEDGDIYFDGKSVSKVNVNKREIGMVFQSYALFPHMTVEQNVAYGLEQKKIPKEEIIKKVQDALKRVHMENFAKRKPKQLSGGQQQRVALARALVISPKVLLLDECLSALDKKLRVEMQTELRRILEESHVTTFFVTHDQEEAMTLSDTIMVMHDGIIEQTGNPIEVYEHPKNKFVAGFLGKANFFEGLVTKVYEDSADLQMKEGIFRVFAKNLKVGEKVSVAVRPEMISLSREKRDDAFACTVKTLICSGSQTNCTLDWNGKEILAEIRNAYTEKQFVREEKLYLSWNPVATIRLEG